MALALEAEGTCAQTPNVKNCPLLPLQTGSGPRPFQTPPPENYRRIFLAAILGTAKQRKNIMPNKKKKRGEARFSPTALSRRRYSEKARAQRAAPSAYSKYAFSEAGAQPAASLQGKGSQTLLRSVILQLRCYLRLQHYLQI